MSTNFIAYIPFSVFHDTRFGIIARLPLKSSRILLQKLCCRLQDNKDPLTAMAERLRRLIRNHLGLSRVGSNPARRGDSILFGVAADFFVAMGALRQNFRWAVITSRHVPSNEHHQKKLLVPPTLDKSTW